MLLSELTNFSAQHDATFFDALNAFVAKHGLEAFEGGQAVVVGRGLHVWRAWFNDPGYERFLKYIEANKGNKFLPRILSRVREEPTKFKRSPARNIKYVKIEKLTDPGKTSLTDALDMLHFASIPTDKLPSTAEELAELSSTFCKPNQSEVIRGVFLKHKEFFEVVLDLIKNHNANDLTSGNVMMRGEVPVIIDPFKD